MKRFLSLLTSLMLLLGSLPVAAWADTYTYPEITITIPPSDMAQLELAFRAWAAELVADYYYSPYNVSANPSGMSLLQPYSEYYRMASTKKNFDKGKTNDDNVIYNMQRQGVLEEQKRDALTMWALKETLKDATLINSKAIMEEYKKLDEDARSYLLFDPRTGTMQSNKELFESLEDVEDNLCWMALVDTVTNMAVTTSETYLKLKLAKSTRSGAPELSDLVSGFADAVRESADFWTEAARNNAEATLQNTLRSWLISDMANQMAYLNDRSVMFLRDAYSGTLSFQREGNNALDAFVAMLTPEENPHLNEMIADKAVSNVRVETIFSSAGLAEMKTIDFDSAFAIGITIAVKEEFKGVLDACCTWLEQDTQPFMLGNKQISKGKVLAIFLDTLSGTLDDAFNTAINQIYDNYFNGVSMRESDCLAIMENCIVDAFTGPTVWIVFGQSLVDNGFDIFSDNLNMENDALNAIIKCGIAFATDRESPQADLALQKIKALMGIEGTPSAKTCLDWIDALLKSAENMIDAPFDTQAAYKNTLETYNRDLKAQKELEDRFNGLTSKGQNSPRGQKLDKRIQKNQQDLNKTKQQLDKKTIVVWLNMVDDIFDAYFVEPAKLVNSALSDSNNEGSMSLLAGAIASSHDLSVVPMSMATVTIRDNIPNSHNRYSLINTIQDPTLVSTDTLTSLVSTIHAQVKYDISGTLFYYDLAFHTWVVGDYFWNWEENDRVSRYWTGPLAADFFDYTQKHHNNVDGTKGILYETGAAFYYNKVVTFYDTHFQNTYDPAWDVFFEEANGA